MKTTTAGFPIHTSSTAPTDSRPIVLAVEKAFGGMLPNLFAVLAGSPPTIQAAAALSQSVDRTSLTPIEQQVIELAVSRQNRCDYCLAAHSFLARLLPQGPIVAAREGNAIEDPRLEALRQLAIEMAATNGHVSEQTRARFREVGYSDGQALEVITVVTLKTLHNLVNNFAKTPIDSAFAQVRVAA